MKEKLHSVKNKMMVITCLSLLSLNVFGQYNVTVSYSTYTELTGATNLPYNSTDDGYYYQTNFTFPVFGTRHANFNLDIAHGSNGAFMSSQGILAIYDTPGYVNTIVFQCLYDHDDFKTVAGITKALAVMQGVVGSRILKFQWKNIINAIDTNQRVNFQVWFHEIDSSISYHYGPNTLDTQADQVYCGIVVFNATFTSVLNECNVEGSPTIPAIYDTFTTPYLPTLDTVPRNGLVYTFKPKHSNATRVNEIGNDEDFNIYPNPATRMINIVPASDQTGKKISAELLDIFGNVILSGRTEDGILSFNTDNVPAGIYYMKITSEITQAKKVFIYR